MGFMVEGIRNGDLAWVHPTNRKHPQSLSPSPILSGNSQWYMTEEFSRN